MSKVVSGSIAPIKSGELRFFAPIDVDGVHSPQLLMADPVVCAPVTIDHARRCALELVEKLSVLPHSTEAGDLLAMAYAILHFTKE